MTVMMPDQYWKPDSVADVSGQFLDNDRHVWCWSKASTGDAPLSILVVDDVQNLVIFHKGAFAIGTDEYVTRLAIESLLGHRDVREVLFVNFYDGVIDKVHACRMTEIRQRRMCVLLDVYGPRNDIVHGVIFAPLILKWGLPVCNLAQFSKEGAAELSDMGFTEVISKNLGMSILQPYTKLSKEIRSWLDECSMPFASTCRSNAGQQALAGICSVLDEFHVFPFHNAEDCLTRQVAAKDRLRDFGQRLNLTEFEKSLYERGLLDEETRKKLMLPLTSVTNVGTTFVLSKSLSRNGARGTNVPGHWLEIVLDANPSLGLSQRCFSFKEESPQPIAGFLQAIFLLRHLAATTVRAAVDGYDLLCEIEILADEKQGGVSGLRILQTEVEGIFEGRSKDGEMSEAFEALFCAGVKMRSCKVSGDKLAVLLVFEMVPIP